MTPSEIPGFTLIKSVCREMLKINPRERFDCVEALSFIDPENSILNTPTGKAWKKEKDAIRLAIKTKI